MVLETPHCSAPKSREKKTVNEGWENTVPVYTVLRE